jgi:hypothetical protein
VEICDGSTAGIIADHTETLRLGDLQTVKVGVGRITPYGGGISEHRSDEQLVEQEFVSKA